jgi:hypothetical protein
MNNTLIGPFFIEGNLNSNSFLRLLQEQIIPQIQNLNVNDVWFQMDGAPPHSTAMITRYLNEIFGERWIGRFGPRHACNELDPNFIRNCVQGFHNRLAYCLEREGGHFEYLIK